MWIEYFVLLPAIVLHELGHYIGYKLFGYESSIKFKWWGIEMGKNCYPKLILWKAYVVTLLGVIVGFVYLLLVDVSQEVLLIYFIMSIVDINNIIQILSFGKEYKDKSLIMIARIELDKFEKEQKRKQELR